MTAYNPAPYTADLLSDEATANGLVSFDLIASLISEYKARSAQLESTFELIQKAESSGLISYFIAGARLRHGYDGNFSMPRDLEAADAALRSEYWSSVLSRTDVFDAMPTQMRVEARAQFNGLDCPAFDETTVRPTIQSLLAQRNEFFAKRVDGVFENLSGDHVTNQPNGFSRKMIINNVFDCYGCTDSFKAGIISDLRSVISRMLGRGEHNHYATDRLLSKVRAEKIGKKVSIDGGAITMTVYKAGTVHLTIHDDLAIELNSILASLYPLAIPASFRTPKKSHAKTFEIQSNLLPAPVIDKLSTLDRRWEGYSYALSNGVTSSEKAVTAQTLALLEDIGGTTTRLSSHSTVTFDYEAAPIIESIILTGRVTDNASAQFYPTRSTIADEAIENLSVTPGKTYLEPQAGTGDLAAYLPKESTTCVELDKLRCKVLEQKGFNTINADFLSWADKNAGMKFDGIAMNPPFSKGRALLHLKAASTLLAEDGRLVAILPASMINTAPLQGFEHDWSQVYVDMFEGTSVRVVILTATKQSI